jgi:spermidine/putrescine transport system substrate-binding protein
MTDRKPINGATVSRRRFLVGGTVAGFAAFLAACGTKGTGSAAPASVAPSASPGTSVGPTASSSASPTTAPSTSSELNWANWTYYMDVDPIDKKKFKTLEDFKAKYGTTVNYQEVIDDNESFIGTIQPQLQAGQDTGWDIVVLTDWMASRVIRLGWAEQMDPANLPNVTANLQDIYKNVSWDATNGHHVPWQSGMTGLGYDTAKTGKLTSLGALWDSKYKGKVDFLTEMRDTVGLTMLKLGIDPSKATRADADAATAEIKKAKDAGIIRSFKGNAYAEDLKSGDVVLAMAWSGDMVQALVDKRTLAFTVADEGGMLWTDNCIIPKGAQHKYTAEVMINFCYQPEIAAQIEAYVNYICPVKGAADVLKAANPAVANNPLIFPPKEILDRLHIFIGLNEADEKYFNDKFATVGGLG